MMSSPKTMKANPNEPLVDLWQKLIDERHSLNQSINESSNQSSFPTNQSINQSTSQSREATLLYIGPSQSGKSSLIQSYMFKDRIDTPKPTNAIDYRYTRTSIKQSTNQSINQSINQSNTQSINQSISRSISDDKSLSHFFELGGGDLLIDCLIDQSITVKSINQSLCIVVIDCSRPSNLLIDCSNYLMKIRKRVEAAMLAMKNNQSVNQSINQSNIIQTLTQLAQQQRKRFGELHPDLNRVNLMPIQTLIIANKYDTIAHLQPEELRVFCHSIRLLAHRNGCALMFTSQQHKDQLNKTYRSRISHHLMGSEKKPTPQLSHLDLLAIPQGGDSYALIGHPYDQSINQSTNQSTNHSSNPIQPDKMQDEWQKLFSEYFPLNPADREQSVNLSDLALAAEPAIDRLIDQKTDELKRRQREIDLQRKLIAQDRKIVKT